MYINNGKGFGKTERTLMSACLVSNSQRGIYTSLRGGDVSQCSDLPQF